MESNEDRDYEREERVTKEGDREDARKMNYKKGILLAAAMAAAAAMGASGVLMVQKVNGMTSAAEEASMDVGGRISDRIEDVNDVVSENTDLIRDTKELVEASDKHYEEIRSVLETIRKDLSEGGSAADTADMNGSESTGITAEDTEAVVSADLSYNDQKDLTDSIDRILSDIDDLIEKTDDGSKETKELLNVIEKEGQENTDNMEDILDTYYSSISSKNENLSRSLTELENIMTGSIDKLRSAEGDYYENMAEILDKSRKELTDTVDDDIKTIEGCIDTGKTELTKMINGETDSINERLSEDCNRISEQLENVNYDAAQRSTDILSAIEECHTEQTELLDSMADSLSFMTGEDGSLEDIRSGIDRLSEDQNELYTLCDNSAGILESAEESLSDYNAELSQMNDTLESLEETVSGLKDGDSEEQTDSDDREELRAALAVCGIQTAEDASFEELCDTVRSLAGTGSEDIPETDDQD